MTEIRGNQNLNIGDPIDMRFQMLSQLMDHVRVVWELMKMEATGSLRIISSNQLFSSGMRYVPLMYCKHLLRPRLLAVVE